MAITGNSDTRCIKAVQIVADAGQWLKCRMADGRKAYGIRSSRDADHIYFVTRETCDCDDARRHPGQAYKHSIAARIHCARVTGTQMAASDTIDALAGMAVQRLETRVEFDARTGSVRQAPRELTAEEIAAERALFAHLKEKRVSTKQLVTLSGSVEQVNAKGTGIKVTGEWLNVSQFHPVNPMPTPGELVEVQLEQSDRGAWIHSLKIIGASTPGPAPAFGRDVEIRRQVAMKCVAELVSAAMGATRKPARIGFSRSPIAFPPGSNTKETTPLPDARMRWKREWRPGCTNTRPPVCTEPKGWKRNDAAEVYSLR